jgi:amidase
MNAADLAFLPALDQARLIRKGELSPVDLAELYLERIEQLNPMLGAYLTVSADFALALAKEAERALGDRSDLPPLHGVSVSVKDLIDTAGIRTTHGAKAFADRVPDIDAEVVVRTRHSGMAVLGKTNTPEFGSSIVSEPDSYPPARNPWNTDLSPGGSSGGAGAALAAGLCSISIGSDGGGSVRIPSSWCGLVGIKPSRGRVSDAPRANNWYGHTGPMGRTVADAAALLDVLAGYETGDAFWTPPGERAFLVEASVPVRKLRVAVTTAHPNPSAQTAEPNRRAAEETAELLAELGHEVVEAAPPEMEITMAMLISAAGTASRADLPPVEQLEPINAMLVQIGKQSSAADLTRVMDEIQRQSRAIVAFFDGSEGDAGYDVLLTPTVAGPPPAVGEFAKTFAERPHEVALILDKVPFTPTWNQTGQPAISLPLATDDTGFPVGVQFVGRPNDEATLIRLGAQLEAARPWIDRRPAGV